MTSIVFNSTQSGAAIANEVNIRPAVDGLPFGGIGPSGNGAHTGKYTFDLFTHLRSSMDSPSWIDKIVAFRFPPYNDSKLKAASRLVPGLPSRPTGPPSTVTMRSKWWGKWFLLAILVTIGLAKKMTNFPRQ